MTRDEIFEKWCEALESGNYKQGPGLLKYKHPNGTIQHCCLGVLCDILEVENSLLGNESGKYVFENNHTAGLPEKICDLLEISSYGTYSEDGALVGDNDILKPFSEIAQIIRANKDNFKKYYKEEKQEFEDSGKE